jgi:hypothetical protein
MFFKGLKACWDDLITFFTLPPLESKPKKEKKQKDIFDMTYKEILQVYPTHTDAMIVIFKSKKDCGMDPFTRIMIGYLREEYFRKHPDDKL